MPNGSSKRSTPKIDAEKKLVPLKPNDAIWRITVLSVIFFLLLLPWTCAHYLCQTRGSEVTGTVESVESMNPVVALLTLSTDGTTNDYSFTRQHIVRYRFHDDGGLDRMGKFATLRGGSYSQGQLLQIKYLSFFPDMNGLASPEVQKHWMGVVTGLTLVYAAAVLLCLTIRL